MTGADGDTGNPASSVGATATMVAAGRAIASKAPHALIDDPFAEPLVEAVGMEFFTKQVRGELDVNTMDASALAFVQSMVDGTAVRTKYFDECFHDAVDAGIRQVVILAAGLDARAYRLAWPPGTVVYEVDRPAMLAFKTATLAELGAEPNAECRLVPIDLRDDWPAALRTAGLDAAAPTAWSLEGLLQYLAPGDQNLLLDNVTGMSVAGSTIIADYNSGAGDLDQGSGEGIAEAWRRKGFTLDMASMVSTDERRDAAAYLTDRGWRVDRRPVSELFAAYDMEQAGSGDDHPFANAVYVSGTLRGPGSVSR